MRQRGRWDRSEARWGLSNYADLARFKEGETRSHTPTSPAVKPPAYNYVISCHFRLTLRTKELYKILQVPKEILWECYQISDKNKTI